MTEKVYGTPDFGHSLTLGGYVATALFCGDRDTEWLNRMLDSGGFDRVVDALREEVNKFLKAEPLSEVFHLKGETFYGPVWGYEDEWLARAIFQAAWEAAEGKFWDFVSQNDPDARRLVKDGESICLVTDGEAVRAFTNPPEVKHSFVLMEEEGEHPFFLYAVEPGLGVLREWGARVAPGETLLTCLQNWPPDWKKPRILEEVIQYIKDTGPGSD